MGMETERIRVTVEVAPGTQLKGVRAFMVLTKLQEFATVIDSVPDMEKLENGDFEDKFVIICETGESSTNIINDLEQISEIQSVTVEDEGDQASEAKEDQPPASPAPVAPVVEATPAAESAPAPAAKAPTQAAQVKEIEEAIEEAQARPEDDTYIVFQIGKEEFSLPINNIMGIERSIDITRIPNMPAHIIGVCNLRGVIIPVVDLKKKFSGHYTELTDASRIIVCSYEGMDVGFYVDSAREVLNAPQEYVETSPDIKATEATDYIKSLIHMNNRIIILLDIEKLFLSDNKKLSLDEAE